MLNKEKTYIAIDLKSFYASVECMQRNIDPLDAYLVVADKSRTSKTICLAVTPALKSHGIAGRARLFEVEQAVAEINAYRRLYLRELYEKIDATGRRGAVSKNFIKKCYFDRELKAHPEYKLDFIIATPQMAKYVEVSTQIFKIYLKFISEEDIHVYSIDEVFIDATPYLTMYQCDGEQLAKRIIDSVLKETGITATVGIGTNMYLAKIAMDVLAKKMEPDKNGVRIAKLNENTYRQLLWNHRPLTDFWSIGPGYLRRLATYGMHTMGDIAKCSVDNEDLLYEIFGINAELLIDHAWGWEPCTIADVKAYKPVNTSVGHGQVLTRPYKNAEAKIVLKEMAEQLALELVQKHLYTKQLVIHIGYDIKNLLEDGFGVTNRNYYGEEKVDNYGRKMPKYARSTINLSTWTSSASKLMKAAADRFKKVVDKDLFVRRINITATRVVDMDQISTCSNNLLSAQQLDIFTDYEQQQIEKQKQQENERKEIALQESILEVKSKFGKNALLKGMNFKEGATARERNRQIGGHKA